MPKTGVSKVLTKVSKVRFTRSNQKTDEYGSTSLDLTLEPLNLILDNLDFTVTFFFEISTLFTNNLHCIHFIFEITTSMSNFNFIHE